MEETLILDVKIDQADAQKQLVVTEKSILSLKKEAADLRKEYNAGKISEDEYVESNLKLQKAIKIETEQKRTLTKLVETESNSRNALKARVSQLTKEYDNLDRSEAKGIQRAEQLEKELRQLNAEITKTSKGAGLFKDQIGNYPEAMDQATKATVPFGKSLSDATNEVQPFGLSVGGATSTLAKFATPATAALGLIAGLGAAYASSAVGARDLQTAQDLLGASASILTNQLGDLFDVAEGGPGILTASLQTALSVADSFFGSNLAAQSAAKASATDLLRQLEISEAFAQAAAKNSERRAENARRIRDDEKQDLDERLRQTQIIDTELQASAQRSVTVLQAQRQAIIDSTVHYDRNRQAQLQVAQIDAEIADKEEEINGKLTENVTARRTILDLIKEQNDLEAGVARANQRLQVAPGATINKMANNPSETGQELQQAQQTQDNIINARADRYELELSMSQKFNADLVKFNNDAYLKDVENKRRANEIKQMLDERDNEIAFASLQGFAAAAAGFFKQESAEYKAIATAQTLISTYSAATKAYEAAFLPLPTVASPALGVAFAAAAVAQGLANVAQINGIQFAEGGYTGPGAKYDVAGIVHKGEYVAPQHVVNSPAAQPHLQVLENMRTRGYADGGFVTTESISATQQALIMANAIRNLPPAELSLVETARGLRRVAFRENSFTKL